MTHSRASTESETINNNQQAYNSLKSDHLPVYSTYAGRAKSA